LSTTEVPRSFCLGRGPSLCLARLFELHERQKDLQWSVRIPAMRERHYVIGGEMLGRATHCQHHGCARIRALVRRAVSLLTGRAPRPPTSSAALSL
jgi:hypothetical protein